MNIQQVRTVNCLLATIIIVDGGLHYCWYLLAMQLSLEVLNRQPLYLNRQYQVYNFIFWAYCLLLPVRLRTTHFSDHTEWLINSAEHLFFGIVICLKVYIYTAVSGNNQKYTRWQRAWIAWLLFNLIGLANEVFQNLLCGRPMLVFIPDSVKDIRVNLLGAVVFITAVCCRIGWLKNQMKIKTATRLNL